MAIQVNLKQVQKWLARKNLYEFIKCFWDAFDTTSEFIDSWLIEYQCECFMYSVKHFLPKYVWEDWITDEQYEEIKDLAQNDPKGNGLRPECPVRDKLFNGQHVRNHDWNIGPRHMKSTIHNICGPTWLAINTPITVASVSHNQTLSTEMNTKRQKLLQSQKFTYYFGKDVELKLKKSSATELELLNGSKLYSVPMVSFTGFGADLIIADDLITTDHARKGAEVLKNTISFFKDTLPTRRNNPKTSVIWQIQQRVGMGDVSGIIQDDKNLSQVYSHTELPAIFPKDEAIIFPCSGKVKFIKKGEYLWSARFGDYTDLRLSMSENEFNTQYNQDPTDSDLNIVKSTYLHWATQEQAENIKQFAEFHYASHDCAVQDAKSNDFHGFNESFAKENTLLITDAWERHMGYVKEKELMENMEMINPGIIQVVENKANGAPLLQELKDSVPGLDSFDPGSKSKGERLSLASIYIKNGNVLFEDNENVRYLVDRLLRFPLVEHDDIVDACAQVILYHFSAKKLGVFNGAFGQKNIVPKDDTQPQFLRYAAYMNGDQIKVLSVSLDNGNYTVEEEWLFRGIRAFEDFFIEKTQMGGIFYDASSENALSRICTRCFTLIKFNDKDPEKSINLLKGGFFNNKVFIRATCTKTISDIAKLRVTSNSRQNGNNRLETSDEGYEKCLRAIITDMKGLSGIWF